MITKDQKTNSRDTRYPFTKTNNRARQHKSCKIMVTTRFKSHPYTDKKRICTVTERTEMSHTKPLANLNQIPQRAAHIRTTVAELQEV